MTEHGSSHPPFFGQARLKLKWSEIRLTELHSHWERFTKTEFCKIDIEDDEDGSQCLRVVSVEPFPAEIPLVLGETIHNMRSALDYAISEILSFKDTRLTFPMGEEREELVSSFRTDPQIINGRTVKAGRNAPIERAIPGIGKFITDEIRPYKASGGFLWPLNKLDGRDKHRLLLPVVVPQSITGIDVIDKNNNRMIDCTAGVGAGGISRIARFGAGGLRIQNKGKPVAEILLHEPGIVEQQRLFPLLVQMGQATAQCLDSLEVFVRAARGG